MEYRVISAFNDLLDGGFLYNVGMAYPRTGAPVANDKRIAELSSNANKLGKPLIQKIEEKQEEEEEVQATHIHAQDEIEDNEEIRPARKKRGKRYEDN